MRWSSSFVYLSAAVLVAAVVAAVESWPEAMTQWLLLAWAALLLPVAGILFRHPMRWPAWGLFLGFWGGLAVIALIVLQALAVAGVLRPPARAFAEAWPLAVFAVWLGVTSVLGAFERDGFPPQLVWLGAIAGGSLFLQGVVGIAGLDGLAKPAALLAAGTYILWASALSGELWAWRRAPEGAPPVQAPAAPPSEPAAEPVPAAAAP